MTVILPHVKYCYVDKCLEEITFLLRTLQGAVYRKKDLTISSPDIDSLKSVLDINHPPWLSFSPMVLNKAYLAIPFHKNGFIFLSRSCLFLFYFPVSLI